MELIDRNELLSGIRPVSKFDEKWACTGRTVKELMIEHINKAPTVDAVPVVRCKDCVHWCATVTCSNMCLKYDPDAFCSHGERKTDENNQD